ncbi:MAG: hypothetical protein ACI88A_002699, partial [Paraglaciecola sp.]
MNGRVYDYNLGRFMSVDPYVHEGSQGLNPYSYIMNNPLSGTDPSGYAPEKETMTGSRIPGVDTGASGASFGAKFDARNGGSKSNGAKITSESIVANWQATLDLNGQEQVATAAPESTGGVGKGKNGEAKTAASLAIPLRAGLTARTMSVSGTTATRAMAANPILMAIFSAVWSSGLNVGEDEELAELELGGLASNPILAGLSKDDQKRLTVDLANIRTKPDGRQGVQYALVADMSGEYTCYTCVSGSIFLNEGDVWKYGKTTRTDSHNRYSDAKLSFLLGGLPLRQFNQFFGTDKQIKIAEKVKIYTY